jgi:glycosyltransferase involved in cell wall biosynthesis
MTLKPLVLLPTYNSGVRLAQTLREAHAEWHAVWVVVDASTDGSDTDAESLGLEGVKFLRLLQNAGKGAAVLVALQAAQADGFTHVLVMDADGQHPAAMIRPFFEISKNNPSAFVCGVPVFGPDAPLERVLGRRAAAGNDKPFDPDKTMRSAYEQCHRSAELLTQAGGYDVRWIDHLNAVGTVVQYLKDAEA